MKRDLTQEYSDYDWSELIAQLESIKVKSKVSLALKTSEKKRKRNQNYDNILKEIDAWFPDPVEPKPKPKPNPITDPNLISKINNTYSLPMGKS